MKDGHTTTRVQPRRLVDGFTWLGTLVLALVAPAAGQQQKTTEGSGQRSDMATLIGRLSKSRADVVKATVEYKASVEKLVALYEAELKQVEESLLRHKELFSQGLVSRLELERTERAIADVRVKIEMAQKQIRDADHLVAEVVAAEQIGKTNSLAGYTATGAFIRFNGLAKWSIAEAGKVQGFFQTNFGQGLPVSAFGQSAFHERMGFDHSNAIDVAVHPDSREGAALMEYLRAAGIPFIAFRQAVPGSATGAHIHIGRPSQRIFRPSVAH